MRAWLRERLFERTSWVLVGGVAFCHAALVVWLARSAFPSLPAVATAIVAFVASVLWCRAMFAHAAPRERHGGSASTARQLALEAGFAAMMIGGAVLAGGVAQALADGVAALAGRSADGTPVVEVFAALGVALVAVGFVFGRTLHQETEHRVPPLVADSPEDEHVDLRIVHLSDLHIGNPLTPDDLDALADRICALDPDLVVLTGDLFDRRTDVVDDGARALGRLAARYGVFAILGNHDAYTGRELVADALARHCPALALLRDRATAVDGLDLTVVGHEDPGEAWCDDAVAQTLGRLAAGIDDPGRSLLLMHRPDPFPVADRLGFGLVLAGHYHGGQFALPGSGGRVNVARLVSDYDRGLFHGQRSTLFVSRGLGMAGPRMRIACPTEVAVLETRARRSGAPPATRRGPVA